MAIGTPVAIATNSNTATGDSVVAPVTVAVASGSSILCAVNINVGSAVLSTVTDSAGNTYEIDVTRNRSGNNPYVAIASCHNCLALTTSDSITATFTASQTAAKTLNAYSVSGLDSTALDKIGSNSGTTSSAWTSGDTGLLTQANEILFVIAMDGSRTSTPTGGWAELVEQADADGGNYLVQYKIVSATTAINEGGAYSATANFSAAVATYKESSGGTLHEGGGDLDATSGLSGKAGVTATGGGGLSSTGTVDGAGSITASGGADVSASSSLAGSASSTLTSGGSVSGTSDLAGAAGVLAVGGGEVSGTSDLSGSGGMTTLGGGNLSGTSTLAGAADVLVVHVGGGMMSASSDLEGAGSLVVGGSGTLLGVSTLQGRATVTYISSGLLSAESSLVGAGTVPRFGKPTTGYIGGGHGHLAGPRIGRIDRPTTGGAL